MNDDTLVTCFIPFSGKLVYSNNEENVVNTEFREVEAGDKLTYPWKTAAHLWFASDSKPNTLVSLSWWEMSENLCCCPKCSDKKRLIVTYEDRSTFMAFQSVHVYLVSCLKCGFKGPTADKPNTAVQLWNSQERSCSCHQN